MEVKNLMIGDLVLYVDKEGEIETPCKIQSLNKNGEWSAQILNSEFIFQGDNNECSVEECLLPIPITPEILEKNGIKLFSTYTHPYRDGEWEEGELEEAMKHYPMYVYQTLNPNITFVIRPNEQELKVCSSNYKTRVEKKEEVIFVHELQHALKLCGIDKEIKI